MTGLFRFDYLCSTNTINVSTPQTEMQPLEQKAPDQRSKENTNLRLWVSKAMLEDKGSPLRNTALAAAEKSYWSIKEELHGYVK